MSTLNLNNPPATFIKTVPTTSDNYAPQGNLFLVNPASNINISGFTARSNAFLLSFTNVSVSNTVTFLHQSTSSTIYNRITLPGSSPTSFVLTPGNTIQFRYDGFDRTWRVWGDTGFVNQSISTTTTVTRAGNRQCVVNGPVDSNFQPNFLTFSGLNVSVSPQSEPVVISFADGLSNGAAIDRYASIPTTVTNAWPNLPTRAVSFLYVDRDPITGSLTYGYSPIEPTYSRPFKKNRNALLHFNGANDSTAIVDDYGNTWVNPNNAPLKTTNPKFGSAALQLNGTNHYIYTDDIEPLCQEWSLEAQVRATSFSNSPVLFAQKVYSASIQHTLLCQFNTSGQLVLYVSTDNVSWNVVNALTSSTALSINTYAHVRVDYNGSNYRIFINGVQTGNVASTIRHYTGGLEDTPCRTFIGVTVSGYYLSGTIDEVRITTRGSRGQNNFTPPTTEYVQDVDWFDLNTYKMYSGGPVTGWTSKQRVYVGEAITNDTQVTSVVNYAYNGETVTNWVPLAYATSYSLSHNISSDDAEGQVDYTWFVSIDPQHAHISQGHDIAHHSTYGWFGLSGGFGSIKPRRNFKSFVFLQYIAMINGYFMSSGYGKFYFRRRW